MNERIALEVSICGYRGGQDFEVVPLFCLLDTWNGYELADFINREIHPPLYPWNYPVGAKQLAISQPA